MSLQVQWTLGQRVSQEVSSVVTQYLLDTQPSLARLIQADDGTDVNRYVHDMTGIHSHQDPNGDWNWVLKDGLGSVRAVRDDTGMSVFETQYDPYGVKFDATGENPLPFEYTEQPYDQNGLQYHRARYYDPMLGVWVSLDPLETDNRYGYVSGNPTNRIDPTGFLEDDQARDATQTRYSCNCGWIDWSHATTDDKIQLLQNVRRASELATFDEYSFFTFRQHGTQSQVLSFTREDIVAREILANSTEEDQIALAVSMFMDYEEGFEQFQADALPSWGDWIANRLSDAGIWGKPARGQRSAYSEEDLVSDLIGFYQAKLIVYDGFTPQGAKEKIRDICLAFTPEDSIKVWKYTYHRNTTNVISMATSQEGWRRWEPRLLDLLDCQGNTDSGNSTLGQCNRSQRSFPHQLEWLVSLRNPSLFKSKNEFLTRFNGYDPIATPRYISNSPDSTRFLLEEQELRKDLYAYTVLNQWER